MALRVTRQYDEVLSAGDGELRVTRQSAEVLSAGDGEIRVTRQYVEILSQAVVTYNESASNTLNFVQNIAVGPMEWNRSISNTINFSQNIIAGQDYQQNVANTLNFVSTVSRVFEKDVTSNVSFTQDIIESLIVGDFIPLESAMTLSQQVDVVVNNDQYVNVSNIIVFTQQVSWQGPHYFYINTYLNLEQDSTSVYGCPWQPVEIEDDLGLSHVLNRTQDLSVNNVMTLVGDTYRKQTPTTTLNLAQVLSWGKAKGLQPTEMELNQTVKVNAIYVRSLSHTNILGHALTYFVDTPCGDKQYMPFIGENTIPNAPSAPSTSIPIIQNDSTITRFKLIYPALASPIETIELRAPELDNIDRDSFNRISRETRGGKLIVFADPMWPQVQTLIVTFIGLTKTEVDDIQNFFTSYIGEEIRLQDWEGREWVGIVTTPNEPAVADGKGSICSENWTVTFEFEGVLIDGFAPADKLNLTDYVTVQGIFSRGLSHDLGLIQSATYIKV